MELKLYYTSKNIPLENGKQYLCKNYEVAKKGYYGTKVTKMKQILKYGLNCIMNSLKISVVALYWTDFYNKTIPTKARKITDLFI